MGRVRRPTQYLRVFLSLFAKDRYLDSNAHPLNSCAPGFSWTLDCERVIAGGVSRLGNPGRADFQSVGKREVVLRLLRGEALESVSRAVGITAARASQWRDQFLVAGQAGLKSRAPDARDDANRQLQAKIGELLMEKRSCSTRRWTSWRRAALWPDGGRGDEGRPLESISYCFTQLRNADSVRSNSWATCPMLRSCCKQSRAASFLNASVNRRRFRWPMNTSRRLLAPSGVSTKPRQVQGSRLRGAVRSCRAAHTSFPTSGFALAFDAVRT